MQSLLLSIYTFLASRLFFRIIFVGLVLSAIWIALTGQYPMAFDEDFHLGLIRIYASHSLPFWSSQPANADAYGAVARDPSYLYHFLMSFPYRLICLFTNDQTIQVIILRFLNIAMFSSCLPLFKRLLERAGASSALANSSLAVFVLIPITPQLAAQINYDNMLLPIVALILYLTLSISLQPVAIRPKTLLYILALGITGSLIKFAFLPIFLAILLWLLLSSHKLWKARTVWTRRFLALAKTKSGLALLGLVLILSVLGFERYGINVIRYHDPIPECGYVLTLDHCKNYGPYIRDYNFAAAKSNYHTTPYDFSKEWIYGMWLRSFFAVDGPKSLYETRGPFIIPADAALALFGIGILALLLRGRNIWRRHPASVSLFALVTLVYVAALWLQEYKAYRHTGFPVAINGRYLLPVILLAIFLMTIAISELLGRRSLKTGLVVVSLAALLCGGGALTYILRSADYWYWPNPTTHSANHLVKRVIGPVLPGYDTPTAFLP